MSTIKTFIRINELSINMHALTAFGAEIEIALLDVFCCTIPIALMSL